MTTLGTVDLQLSTLAQEVLAGDSTQKLITKATVNNQDSVAQTVTVYRVPALGTPGTTNIIVPPLVIPAGETYPLPLSAQAVLGSDSLQALASADSVVNINLTYEVVPTS